MRRRTKIALCVIALSGCAGAMPAPESAPSLFLIGTPPPLTLCQGSTRHVALSGSWHGSTQPDPEELPEFTWISADPQILEVGSRSGALTGLRAGATDVIILGHLANAPARTSFRVSVLPGEWDPAASQRAGRTVCRIE